MPDDGCDVVVVGASAGGVEALMRLARSIPPDFPLPILVVLHVPATGPSVLPQILQRAGALPAAHAADGMALDGGGFVIAPPDRHMRVSGTTIELGRGPRENGHRPAIDPLFRSAAEAYGSRAAGVVLSGSLDDGTIGLFCIKEAGGATLAQDPQDALFPAMPANAIAYARPDYILPVEEIVDTLVRLSAGSAGRPGKEVSLSNDQAPDPSAENAEPGELAPFACPDCGGTLWERREGETVSYRCRVGHAFTINSLLARHDDALDRLLWAAYRALEERAAMARRVARLLGERGRSESSARFEQQAERSAAQATELKALLDALEATPDLGLAAVVESQR
jgi:two-component system chemotaxis response regulator CheB